MTVKRRDVLKAGLLTGTGALLGNAGFLLQARARNRQSGAPGQYPLADDGNIIYGMCLQCHTECTLKVKIEDGLVSKIDGNAYSPGCLQPQLDYATKPDQAARVDGSICPKGQAGIQTLYDPYRLRRVLKRAGPRGSGRWKSIPFDQAVKEIVEGGKIFSDSGESRDVAGFRDVFVLRDAELAKTLAADVAAVRAGSMDVPSFRQRHQNHLDVLIDPNHPDLGPKNNQFVFMAGRIEHGRNEFTKRWVHGAMGSINWFAHTTICEQAHHIAFKYATAKWTGTGWKTGKDHMKPDFEGAEFVIFWGTGYAEANFGPPPMTPQITQAATDGRLRYAVVDPRLSKSAAHGWWVPIQPGGDLALALGMIRWIIANERFDAQFLRNANRAAANAHNEKSWSNASWLVDDKTGKFLRADQLGIGKANEFVVLQNGEPVAVDPYSDGQPIVGDLNVKTHLQGIALTSAFRVLSDSAMAHDLNEYAEQSGISQAEIVRLAREFTSHGKKAAIDFYRGPIKFTYGYYAGQAIIALNTLIGNIDWRGGLVAGGGKYDAMKGVFDLGALHNGALKAFGIKTTREGSGQYETSTLFRRDGYPAPRPWFPLTGDVYQEIVPAAAAGYPYPIKILWLHMGTVALSAPAGHLQIDMLKDPEKVPLFIADDIVIGETSMYADYIFPDLMYLERWAFEGFSPAIKVKAWKLRQPAAAPIPEVVTVEGEKMPVSMESAMIAVARRLGAPGYGPDGFAPGLAFKRPEDYYLKMAANVAHDGQALPAAGADELDTFRRARRHLPTAVFDESKWRAAVGEAHWPTTVYLLNRGGRFEPWDKAYKGDHVAHALAGLMNLYAEPVAVTRNAVSRERFSGVPTLESMRNIDGTAVSFPKDYELKLFTYKEIFGGQSRTVGNYAGQQALMPENFVYINRQDARRLELVDGDMVRVATPGFAGEFEVAPNVKQRVAGLIKAIEGVRPGTVAISWHYGHWAYGANDVEVDGVTVKGDPTRRRGLVPNPAMSVDAHLKDVALTDPIAGDSAYGGTFVKLVKIGHREPVHTYSERLAAAVPDDAWIQAEALRVARGQTDGKRLRAVIRDRLGLTTNKA